MPLRHDLEMRRTGTKFRLYPQMPGTGTDWRPETVWLSPPAGSVRPGPADDRMYVCDAVDKREPYEYPDYMPPYRRAARAPVRPGPGGHFDHIPVDSYAFRAAHLYAGVRRTLDIWEGYLGRRIPWHFARAYPQMELIPYVEWSNAQSGFGFIETGYGPVKSGARRPYCLNYDVVAHEIGHSILFSLLGSPKIENVDANYLGFSEASADLVALIAVLHFDSVVDHLLSTTKGNLYTLNELNRLAELSKTEQIRVVVTDAKMSDFARGWSDAHAISLPLSAAVFDILVEIYLKRLVRRRLIGETLARASMRTLKQPALAPAIHAGFAKAYIGAETEFKAALLAARDFVGYALARTWQSLTLRDVSFAQFAKCMLDADRQLSDSRHRRTILGSFRWRGIGEYRFGPRIGRGKAAHEHRARRAHFKSLDGAAAAFDDSHGSERPLMRSRGRRLPTPAFEWEKTWL